MHGGGIDQPLMAICHAYSDSLPGARSIHPQTNARGQYDGGIGSVCTIITDPGTRLDEPHDPYDFPGDAGPPDQGTGPTEKPHCIEVDWPGKSLWPTMERQSRWYSPNHWSGSLLLHSRDPSGQYYRRNRFYDAGSGRFTQEDPIGIAGGLNVYGYANGDPISYSDPYGLSADDCAKVECPKNTREVVENKQIRQFAQELMLASMTDSEGVEYGGFIVRGSDGSLSLENVTRGGVGFVELGRAPDNAIARIHTHPDHVLRGGRRIPFEMPSGSDAYNANQDNVYGIVVTPRNFHIVPVGQNTYHTFPRTQTLMPPIVCSGGCPTPYK